MPIQGTRPQPDVICGENRTAQNTGNFMSSSLRQVCQFFNEVQFLNTSCNKSCETGPTVLSPYPRRLQSQTTCSEGSTPQLLLDPEWWTDRDSNLPQSSPTLNQLSFFRYYLLESHEASKLNSWFFQTSTFTGLCDVWLSISVRAIACVVSSTVSFSNHRPCLKWCKVSITFCTIYHNH